eukprot:scaffold1190_cov393-Prasinococcus_capsulatus_cf.AAC.10
MIRRPWQSHCTYQPLLFTIAWGIFLAGACGEGIWQPVPMDSAIYLLRGIQLYGVFRLPHSDESAADLQGLMQANSVGVHDSRLESRKRSNEDNVHPPHGWQDAPRPQGCGDPPGQALTMSVE